jgi:predicted Zn-dependent protease with MMP-like domain
MPARRVAPEEFEQWVEEAFLRVPARFRKRLENVVIVVEDEPTADDLHRARVPRGSTLFGLYHGVPLTERTVMGGMVLPDRISIYRGPIERAARSEREMKHIIAETLWHEIGHYFGMDEARVRRAERRWRKFRA